MSKPTKSNETLATNNLLGNYRMERTIGEGTFGKVKLAIHIPTEEKVAIKILEKDKIQDKEDLDRIIREINYLKKLKHPNIIKILEIIENSSNFYIIMEYASGGELFNHIVKKRRLDEQEASFFFYQIINGLEHIHKNNIVHRDMKPENLLLSDNKLLKIIDFGLSNQYKPGQLLQTPCGSPCYAAPEMILGKKYSGLMVDTWSSGIILYAMICGFLPFEDKNNDKLYKKILECKYEMPDHVSEKCKDLIKKILTVNPSKRIKLDEIKTHPFVKMGEGMMGRDNLDLALTDKRVVDYVIDQMIQMNYNKADIKINVDNNKHNNITTTYELLMHRARANYDYIINSYAENQNKKNEIINSNCTNDPTKARPSNKFSEKEMKISRQEENLKELEEERKMNVSPEPSSKSRAENINDIIKSIKLESEKKKEDSISINQIENLNEKNNNQLTPPPQIQTDNVVENPKDKITKGFNKKIDIILKDLPESLTSRENDSFKLQNDKSLEVPKQKTKPQSSKKSTSVAKKYKKEFGGTLNQAIQNNDQNNLAPLDLKDFIEKNKIESNNIIMGTPVLAELNRINNKVKPSITREGRPTTIESANFKKRIDTSLSVDNNQELNSFRDKTTKSKKITALIPKNEINLHDYSSNKREASLVKDQNKKEKISSLSIDTKENTKFHKITKSVNEVNIESPSINEKTKDNYINPIKKQKLISDMKIDPSQYATVDLNRRTKNISVSDANYENKSIFKNFFSTNGKNNRTPSNKGEYTRSYQEKMAKIINPISANTSITLQNNTINPIHKAKEITPRLSNHIHNNINTPDTVIYATIDISNNLPNSTKNNNQLVMKNIQSGYSGNSSMNATPKISYGRKNVDSNISSTIIDLSNNSSLVQHAAASPMAKKITKYQTLNIPKVNKDKSDKKANQTNQEYKTVISNHKEKSSKIQIETSSSKNSVNTNNSNLNHTSTSSTKNSNNLVKNLNSNNYQTHNPNENKLKIPISAKTKLIKKNSEKSLKISNKIEIITDIKNYETNVVPVVPASYSHNHKNKIISNTTSTKRAISKNLKLESEASTKRNNGSFNKSEDFACVTISSGKVMIISQILSDYCKESNLVLKEVNSNKFECKKENDSILIEVAKMNNNKILKLQHLNGQEAATKEIIKNIILNVGFS